jgi:hypothetical protein
VRVNGDARNIVFDSNVIRDNQGSGIQVVGTNVSGLEFVNNTITGNGIKAYEGAAAPASTWFANVVSGNGDNLTPPGTGPNGWSLSTPSTMQIDAGDSISFSFSSLGDQPARVLWDFGEGLPSTRLNPRYTYRNPGTYRLTMLAWDALGKASLNETIVEVGRPDGGIGITPGVPEPASAAAAWVLIAIAALRRR